MPTITVTTTSYLDMPEGTTQTQAEGIVQTALSNEEAIYLVRIQRDEVLLER